MNIYEAMLYLSGVACNLSPDGRKKINEINDTMEAMLKVIEAVDEMGIARARNQKYEYELAIVKILSFRAALKE